MGKYFLCKNTPNCTHMYIIHKILFKMKWMKVKADWYLKVEDQNLLRGNNRNGCTLSKKPLRDSGPRCQIYGRAGGKKKNGS